MKMGRLLMTSVQIAQGTAYAEMPGGGVFGIPSGF